MSDAFPPPEPVAESAAPLPVVPFASGDESQAAPKLRRTWPQRLTIASALVAAFGAFAAGSVLFAAQRVIEDRNVVVLDGADEQADDGEQTFESTAPADGDTDGSATDEPIQPVETFPPAEPEAQNFLITGADNNACIDPDSPYAAAFGDRDGFGERSDTIMLWRVNPATSQIAVLSFPRDLWVTIAGRSSEQRINVAYERDNPQRLIDTIYQNFLIEVDHYIQVDFCAFKILVDAVDGVAVPFDFPVRDPNTGLNVPEAGCFNFDGDHALAYVRSRKLEYLDPETITEDDPAGDWRTDGTSDLGRISRQQDFIRRTVDSLLAAGAFNPSVIRALIQTSDDYVVLDSDLSLNKQLEFAGVLQGIDPASITTYQIEARGTRIQGQSVLLPQTGGGNMQAVFAVFRGQATLADAPEQVFETTTTVSTSDEPVANNGSTDGNTIPETTLDSPFDVVETTVEAVPVDTLPEVEAEVNSKGIFPDPNATCD
jgi:LCP family protein required for cell wall assembly